MTAVFEAPPLDGALVRLEPLDRRHAGDLAQAAEESRDAYQFTVVPRATDVDAYISAHLERAQHQEMVPFAQVRKSDGRAVGCTSYCNPRYMETSPELYAVEIGWTWLAASAQRTGINVEAKMLLMGHAFEVMGLARVDLKTDARNDRSRRAIGRLGATFEGVLRSWSASYAVGEAGLLRDSAMFSVVAGEWPRVRAHLQQRLEEGARQPRT